MKVVRVNRDGQLRYSRKALQNLKLNVSEEAIILDDLIDGIVITINARDSKNKLLQIYKILELYEKELSIN